MHTLISILVFLSASFLANAESCEDWFKRLKIAPTDADCEMKCAMGNVDMGSFDCPSRCDQFCKPTRNRSPGCKLVTFWDERLNAKTEPFSKVTGNELQIIRSILSRVPKGFRPSALKAIVRSSLTVDITSSSPASSSDEYLILFSKAFLRPGDLPRMVAHEISHFLIENEWRAIFQEYKQFSGWNSLGSGRNYREGDFDGKFSPEEDFANNIEFYLFDPAGLRSKSPKLFDWIKTKLGAALKLEKGCVDAK